jgi:hypothetical protein
MVSSCSRTTLSLILVPTSACSQCWQLRYFLLVGLSHAHRSWQQGADPVPVPVRSQAIGAQGCVVSAEPAPQTAAALALNLQQHALWGAQQGKQVGAQRQALDR